MSKKTLECGCGMRLYNTVLTFVTCPRCDTQWEWDDHVERWLRVEWTGTQVDSFKDVKFKTVTEYVSDILKTKPIDLNQFEPGVPPHYDERMIRTTLSSVPLDNDEDIDMLLDELLEKSPVPPLSVSNPTAHLRLQILHEHGQAPVPREMRR